MVDVEAWALYGNFVAVAAGAGGLSRLATLTQKRVGFCMAQGTVVIVHGDANARIVATTLLELRGFAVHGAADGAEASALIDAAGAQVVVFDSEVPGADTGELALRLRDCARCTRPLQLLALTDSAHATPARAAVRLGADACLSRPLDPRRFIETVERLANAGQLPTAAQE